MSKESKPETTISEETNNSITVHDKYNTVLSTVENLLKELKNVKAELKTLLGVYNKEVKENKSKSKKKKNKNTSKEHVPHGFTKPVSISPELASFLKVEKDALVSRPSVTSFISKYVKEHKLADEKDGSIFKADKNLKKILGEPRFLAKPKKPELGNGYSYQSLQTYLSPHFQKKET